MINQTISFEAIWSVLQYAPRSLQTFQSVVDEARQRALAEVPIPADLNMPREERQLLARKRRAMTEQYAIELAAEQGLRLPGVYIT